MIERCGICGRQVGHCDPAKHALFNRMRAAPGVIEPLSPLRRDLQTTSKAETAKERK